MKKKEYMWEVFYEEVTGLIGLVRASNKTEAIGRAVHMMSNLDRFKDVIVDAALIYVDNSNHNKYRHMLT